MAQERPQMDSALARALMGGGQSEAQTNLQNFVSGLKGLRDNANTSAISQALQGSSDAMRQVNESGMEDAQKAAQLRNIGTQTALQMSQYDASPQQVDSILKAFNGPATQAENQSDQAQAYHQQAERDRILHGYRLEEMNQKAENAPDKEEKPVPVGALNHLSAIDDVSATAKSLLKKIQSNPTAFQNMVGMKNIGGILPSIMPHLDPQNKEFYQDTQNLFLTLKKKQEGTRASYDAMKMAQPLTPSMTDQPASFLAGLTNLIQQHETGHNAYVDTLVQGGHKQAANLYKQPEVLPNADAILGTQQPGAQGGQGAPAGASQFLKYK